MVLLFDTTAAKTAILLSIFTQENCPDLTCSKIIIFSIIPKVWNEGKLANVFYSFWTVRVSNPGGARFPAPVQTGPGAHPASCTMGTVSFQG
jgi:hypothetical protein